MQRVQRVEESESVRARDHKSVTLLRGITDEMT